MTSKSLTLIAAAGVAATGIGAGALVGASSSSASAATPLCQASQLVPRYERFNGAAGTFGDIWQLINVGATCHTRGWVGALNFGPDGRPLPTTLHRTAGPSHTIVLAHGQHASWEFRYTAPGLINNCKPENAVSMIITPPDNFLPVLAQKGERACNGYLKYESPLVFGG
jgi:hypothetical protein